MKKTLFSVSILSILLMACSKPTHNTSDDVQTIKPSASASVAPEQHATADTAQTSLDWAGEYKGLLPCADCAGIQTELELKADKTYELTEEYQGGKGSGQKFEVKGTFSFDKANPSIIVLDKAAENRKFFVGENYVEARSIDTGEKIHSSLDYKLTKELH